MQSINKAQLISELEPFSDETEIFISVGAKSYPIQVVLSGNGKIYLETPIEIGRPRKYKTGEEIEAAKVAKYTKQNAKRAAKKKLETK